MRFTRALSRMRRSWRRATRARAAKHYNITNQGRITQREFVDLFADALGFPRVMRHVPYCACLRGGFRARGSGAVALAGATAAGDALRGVAAGTLSRIQHGERRAGSRRLGDGSPVRSGPDRPESI